MAGVEMTVTIPSADQRSPISPDRPPRRVPWWLVALLVGLGFALVVAALDGGPEAEQLPPVIAPEVTPPSAAGDWLQVGFPGGGSFTAVAVSTAGAVVAGQTAFPVGEAFVWTSLPGSGEWHSSDIEHADRAVLRDATPIDGGFVLAGAVMELGAGTSVPTLWLGSPGSDFTVVDQSFANPGRVNSVQMLDGELVVTGQSIGPFADALRPGSARFGWVQVRRGSWEVITPPGMSVLVTKIIAVEDIIAADGSAVWLAVGANSSGAAMWLSVDRGASWTAVDLADFGSVVTDVVAIEDGSLRAVTQSWNSDGVVSSQLLAAERGSLEWQLQGFPMPFDVGWISPSSGGLLGGLFNSVQQDTREAGQWGFWHLGADRRDMIAFAGVRAGAGGLFVGAGPTIWTEESDLFSGRPVVDVEVIWRSVGPSWPSDRTFIDTGSTLIAHRENFFEDEIWVRRDPIVWRRVETLESFRAGGFVESPAGLLAWGSVGPDGVVVQIGGDGTLTPMHIFDGTPVELVVGGDDWAVFVDAPDRDGFLRFDMSDGPVAGVDVSWLPADPLHHDGYLLGIRGSELVASRDLGVSWVRVGGGIGYLGVVDDQVVAVETGMTRQVLVLDLAALRLVPIVEDAVEYRGAPTFWAGGVAFVEGESIHLLTVTDGTWQTLVGDHWHGLPHGLWEVIPGPRGFVTSDTDLYRWVGDSRTQG
jgi:hypothetical protein